jgi:hypothetical protein
MGKQTEILSIGTVSGRTERLGIFPDPVLLDSASRDGRAIYLTRAGSDGHQVFSRWDAAGQRESILAEYRGQRQSPFLVSPDERWLVAHDEYGIRVRPLAGGDWKSLAATDTRRVCVTPDGNWVYYYSPIAAARSTLFRVPATGGVPQHLADSDGTTLGNLEISPDRRQIVSTWRDIMSRSEVWSLENFIPAEARK